MENGLQSFTLAIMHPLETSLMGKCTRLENHAPAVQRGKSAQMNIQDYVVSISKSMYEFYYDS